MSQKITLGDELHITLRRRAEKLERKISKLNRLKQELAEINAIIAQTDNQETREISAFH